MRRLPPETAKRDERSETASVKAALLSELNVPPFTCTSIQRYPAELVPPPLPAAPLPAPASVAGTAIREYIAADEGS